VWPVGILVRRRFFRAVVLLFPLPLAFSLFLPFVVEGLGNVEVEGDRVDVEFVCLDRIKFTTKFRMSM